jgi:hypothetical protein
VSPLYGAGRGAADFPDPAGDVPAPTVPDEAVEAFDACDCYCVTMRPQPYETWFAALALCGVLKARAGG